MSNLIISGGVTLSGGFSASTAGGGGGGGGGPTLSVTSGLNMWFKADSLALSDGASVTSWADEQGGAPLVGNTYFPTYVASSMNGKPAVRFPSAGYGQYSSALNMSSRGLPDDFSFFVVAKPNSSSRSSIYVCEAYGNGSTQRFTLYFNMNTSTAFANATHSDWSPDTQVIGSVGGNTPCILASTMLLSSYSQYNPSLPVGQQSSFKGYFNGAQTFSSTDTYGFGNGGNSHFAVGGGLNINATPVTNFDGDVAEIIVYNRVLTTQELADVHSYLGAKYGISV